MAINYTVSYTFAPNTTIQSAQVNTNFSDNANTWTGLEALTKSFAKLKVDGNPGTSLEVAPKQYVDNYATYRRPTLAYSSGTVVGMETGLSGTSGQARILFPDGSLRTDSTTSRIQCTLTQNAAFSGSAQGGIRTGSVANNTWYYYYAVETSDNTSNFVLAADVVAPTQANYSTLNSNFGTSAWVYLGTLPYGDNSGAASAVPIFLCSGNTTVFDNVLTLSSAAGPARGVRLATTSGAASLIYTYGPGTSLSSGQIASTVHHAQYGYACDGQGGSFGLFVENANATFFYFLGGGNTSCDFIGQIEVIVGDGMKILRNTGSPKMDVFLPLYRDYVLGVGSNPQL